MNTRDQDLLAASRLENSGSREDRERTVRIRAREAQLRARERQARERGDVWPPRTQRGRTR